MCRLLYLPAKTPRNYDLLLPWLEGLTKSFGGDGCGYATVRGGAKKGVSLTPQKSARQLSRLTAPVIWHTRRVSCGMKMDSLCHPFETGRGWLAHNGHWSTGAFAARLLNGHWSDSKVAALYAQNHSWKALTKELDSGVWLHLIKSGCQVCYRSGDLYVEQETGALCSEPWKEWGRWRLARTGTYEAGEKVLVREAPMSSGWLDRFQREACPAEEQEEWKDAWGFPRQTGLPFPPVRKRE